MKQYISEYDSSLGKIVLAADEQGLTGLWFQGQKYFGRSLCENHEKGETDILRSAEKWLDIYFSGREPDFMPPVNMIGTDFQIGVWDELLKIPYGTTKSYGDIAAKFGKNRCQHRQAEVQSGTIISASSYLATE